MGIFACCETHPVLLQVRLPVLGQCRLWKMHAMVFKRPYWTATLGVQCLLQETFGKANANRKALHGLHSGVQMFH